MSQIEELDSPETLVTEAVDRFGKLVSDWPGAETQNPSDWRDSGH